MNSNHVLGFGLNHVVVSTVRRDHRTFGKVVVLLRVFKSCWISRSHIDRVACMATVIFYSALLLRDLAHRNSPVTFLVNGARARVHCQSSFHKTLLYRDRLCSWRPASIFYPEVRQLGFFGTSVTKVRDNTQSYERNQEPT